MLPLDWLYGFLLDWFHRLLLLEWLEGLLLLDKFDVLLLGGFDKLLQQD